MGVPPSDDSIDARPRPFHRQQAGQSGQPASHRDDRVPQLGGVALGALRLLARARLPCWRNTCLYRAVAECIVQRGYGIPCRVELGVTPPGESAAIGAHAWVVCEDSQTAPAAAGMIVLR